MESEQDVFSDWAVVEAGGKAHVGKILAQTAVNYVHLEGAFELLVMRGMQPQPDGQMQMVQQNLCTPLPLCTEGTTVHLYVTSIRKFSEMSARDRNEHIRFVQNAQASFITNRAADAGLVTAPADALRSLRGLSGRGNA